MRFVSAITESNTNGSEGHRVRWSSLSNFVFVLQRERMMVHFPHLLENAIVVKRRRGVFVKALSFLLPSF